jgi:hypothetical protein
VEQLHINLANVARDQFKGLQTYRSSHFSSSVSLQNAQSVRHIVAFDPPAALLRPMLLPIIARKLSIFRLFGGSLRNLRSIAQRCSAGKAPACGYGVDIR